METSRAREHAAGGQSVESCQGAIEALLKEIIAHGRFALSFSIGRAATAGPDIEAPELSVNFSGPDSYLLLEANGELLNALEYVVLRAARLDENLFTKVSFDCEDFRRLRREELKLMAQVAAERVVESGDPFPIEHLSARERRVIHLALRDRADVRTESQGYGPERRLVILPVRAGKATRA